MDTNATGPEQGTTSASSDTENKATIDKIQTLLKAKDDTQRFVGLALLKSVLDNSVQVREDQQTVQSLLASISPKFLDRLLRTGSDPTSENAKDMLDLVVSVLHTFAVLLPNAAISQSQFVDRVPRLVAGVLQSSGDTTTQLLQLLHTLVSSEKGAAAFVAVDDLSPLTEIAPSQPIVLDILRFAWLNSMTMVDDRTKLSESINQTMQSLVSSFTTTDAVTLLEFIGDFLRQAYTAIVPGNPRWLKTVTGYIQNLVTSRPTPEARSAYTNAAASLLQAFPTSAPPLLFIDKNKGDKPFAYMFINLLLIDIRSSLPMLLHQLNSPQYAKLSQRLGSSFDIISIFIGYLVKSLEDETMETFIMPPDSLLKLRKSISEAMSVTAEYLRDRWDASFAGAMGLHPDARTGAAETSLGSRQTLTWDALKNNADSDPLNLSALQALAIWLREDDNEALREEATGLTDMMMDLYKSSATGKLDFRTSVLVALEALVTIDQGREILLSNGGWRILSSDLTAVLQEPPSVSPAEDIARGLDIVRVLLAVVELEDAETPEEWMNLITAVAGWAVPDGQQSATVNELHVAVLTLCSAIINDTTPGMRRRYTHSFHAISGIVQQLADTAGLDKHQQVSLDEVRQTLNDQSDNS